MLKLRRPALKPRRATNFHEAGSGQKMDENMGEHKRSKQGFWGFGYPNVPDLVYGYFSMNSRWNIPDRQEGCSTWNRGGGCGSAGRSRCSGAPPWRGSGASGIPVPGAAGGWRRDWRWSTAHIWVFFKNVLN